MHTLCLLVLSCRGSYEIVFIFGGLGLASSCAEKSQHQGIVGNLRCVYIDQCDIQYENDFPYPIGHYAYSVDRCVDIHFNMVNC